MTSLIKDGIYLDFDDSITLRKEARKLNNLTASFTKSYSFSLPITQKNLSALGITSVDQADKAIYSSSTIDLKQGDTVISGNIRVERIDEEIECSFFTDSFDFLKLLTGNIRETRFRDYTYNFPNKGTDGYVDIPINNGTNRTTWNATSYLNYLPCFRVEDLIKDILQEKGIKLQGDIVNDWRYKHLIISNDQPYIEYDEQFVFDYTLFAGKETDQSITGGTTITFTSTAGVYYDNPGWWDGVDEFQTDATRVVAFEANLLFGTSGAHTVSIIGSSSGTVYSTVITAGTSAFVSSYFSAPSTETFRLAVTPASGTISVLAGSSFKVWTFTSFDNAGTLVRATFVDDNPRFLLPSKEKSTFVAEIFSLFNPVIDFNPISKVLTIDFFEKVQTNTQEDWSSYIAEYNLDFEETLQDYGKKSILKFDDSEEEIVKSYNKVNDIPFGGGSLNIDNDFIKNTETILEIPYPPTALQLNIIQQAYLPVFSFFPDEDKLEHRLFLYINTSVVNFSNNTTINSESTLAYGWFVKSTIGKAIYSGASVDDIKVNLGFENPIGYDGRSLKDDYFRASERVLNDPVKITAKMKLPESVYYSLDFSTPKYIKTDKFSSSFFCLSVEGWEASHLPCEVELIKL